jgi:putative acetyltransferase
VTPADFALRAYREDDFAAVGRFWTAAWTAVFPEIDFFARLPWLQAHLRSLAERSVDVLVALNQQGEPCGLLTIDPSSGHLDQLCIAPAAQGQGLAARLVREAKTRSARGVTLDVNDANTKARRLYEREGFRPIGASESAAGLPTTKMHWLP